ncbi:MAG TPA: NUDIX domain-containing protein [Pseudobdellovibrionaceae bacterium]|nr:NUDIX domain-containing protein [Pseudobdellovibrionaceae bacterium]
MPSASFKRISIIGVSGSGKSTLARHLAEATGLPRLEMDAAYWRPNWQTATDQEFAAEVASFAARESWIIDGNYSRAYQPVLERADLVIATELPFWTNFWRVTFRSLRRAFTREELWHGNREPFFRLFTRESIIYWMWTTWAPRRERIRALFEKLAREEFPGTQALPLRLVTDKEREVFLETWRREGRLIRKALGFPVGTRGLLCVRHPLTDQVEPVRGTIDPGETSRQCIIREQAEESGLIFSDDEQSRLRRFAVRSAIVQTDAGAIEFQLHEAFAVEIHRDLPAHWDHCVTGSGVDQNMNFSVEWVPLDQLESRLSPATQVWAQELRQHLAQLRS